MWGDTGRYRGDTGRYRGVVRLRQHEVLEVRAVGGLVLRRHLGEIERDRARGVRRQQPRQMLLVGLVRRRAGLWRDGAGPPRGRGGVVVVGGRRLVGVALDAVALGVVGSPLPLPHLTRGRGLRPFRGAHRGAPTERRLRRSESGIRRYA